MISRLFTSRARPLAITLAVTTLLALASFWLHQLYVKDLIDKERINAAEELSPRAHSIRIAFAELTSKLDALKVFVSLNTSGVIIDSTDFSTFAAGLHAASPWIRTFQIVKDGIVRYSYPIKGNEKIIGYNLMKDPRPFIGNDVLRAFTRNAPTITGPTQLVQGGFGLIMRLPVYRKDSEILGLVAVVLDIDSFLEHSETLTADTRFVFALTDSATGLFYGDGAALHQNPVNLSIPLPDGSWILHAVPSQGWESRISSQIAVFWSAAFVFLTLFAVLIYLIASRDVYLTTTVKEKTEELAITVDLLQKDIIEKEQIQQSLQQSEMRYRALIEANPDMMFVIGRDGTFIDYNNSTGNIQPLYPPSRFLGKRVTELLPPDLSRRTMENVEQTLRIRHTLVDEYTLQEAGERREYEARYSVSGKDTVLALVRDVTTRNRARQAILESEARFRSLAENAPVGIWLAEPNGDGRYINSTLAEISGLDLKSAEGSGLTSAVHPDDKERVIKAWSDFVQGRSPYSLTYRFQKPDGGVRWVDARADSLQTETGTILGFVGTLLDITDQKRAESELRENEERYRRFFEDDLTGDYISTPGGKLLACNPAYARIFGFSTVEEALNSSVQSRYPNEDRRAHFLNLIREKKRLDYFESEYLRSDGTKVFTIENAIGVFDDAGNLQQIRGYIFDETKRKLLEQQFIQSQKFESLGTLAGGVAHDFNNILGIMIGHSSLIEEFPDDLDVVKKNSHSITTAAMRGAALVKQLLAFARKTDVQLEPVHLNEVVGEVSALLGGTFPKSITLELDMEKGLPAIIADSSQVHQVLLNLCVNARDAMPTGGTLTLRTSRQQRERLSHKLPLASGQEYIVLSVSDNGVGMTEETQRRIFEPFFTTKDRGKGTGLGLSLVFGIMENHGGCVDVNSSLGQGTVFDLYFPLINQLSESPEEKSETLAVSLGGNELILLVEDEEMLRDMVETALKAKGYTILTAGDGEEAVDLYRKHWDKVHLILSDMDLPKLSGFEIYQRLKQDYPQVKMVLASGFLEPEKKGLVLREGIRDFIQKPYTFSHLLRTIRNTIDAA